MRTFVAIAALALALGGATVNAAPPNVTTFTRAVVNFTETPGAGTYTANVNLPAGAILSAYAFKTTATWTDGFAQFEIHDQAGPIFGVGDEGYAGDSSDGGFSLGGENWNGSPSPVGKLYPNGQTITATMTTSVQDNPGPGSLRLYLFGFGVPTNTAQATKS